MPKTARVLESLVFNGGFHKYFANRYGQFTRKTVEYLKLIGSDEKASIIIKAYNMVNYEKLNDLDFKNSLLEGRIEKLFLTDELFDALDEIDEKYDIQMKI